MPCVKLKKVHPKAITPSKGTAGAACFDLFAVMDCEIKPGEIIRLSTGWGIGIPQDYALMIYSRSGQGFNNQVTLVNGTGIIDSDYRGTLMIGLRNDSRETYFQPYGKAIAQAMLVYVPFTQLELLSELSETDRGANGFGSTDRFCDKAPEGWKCSRVKDHEGPCAASPTGSPIMTSRHLK